MQIKTPAKINLSLDIIGRRPDGYHALRMVMQTVPLYDEITIEKAGAITLGGNLPYLPYDQRNLAYKAAQAFFQATGICGGAAIYLNKSIPSGAGLGGGSGNAAGVILALNELYQGGLSLGQCRQIGAGLGADVPFFMLQGTCLAEGIGEQLTQLPPMPQGYVVLAKPEFGVHTKWAYQRFDAAKPRAFATDNVLDAIGKGDFVQLARSLGNALEEAVIPHFPLIGAWKEQMMQMGALGSLMSGSGSAVFGLFDDEQKAANCAKQFVGKGQLSFVGEICKRAK